MWILPVSKKFHLSSRTYGRTPSKSEGVFSAENQMEEIMAERKTGETAPEKKQAQEQRVADQENPASLLDVRIHSIRLNESIKATASVNIGGAFAIRGVKVVYQQRNRTAILLCRG
ncbi:hypothetical protein [Anaeromicropila populeti]|uniref:Uncharacterized protein n=1 Tax=Anaeromicropila populeti TaxID=37658 RepID=A0A1I6JGI0_9FIRM|nr:hypothetical protein [Anaeromicropila populeti]SFR78062.1 hypothetical protein SAMN05661086_01665 [Anaeromicropila populeti]